MIPNARVRLEGRAGTALATTNPDGIYFFTGVPDGSVYTLRASAPGHRASRRVPVEIAAGRNERSDFALAPARARRAGAIAGAVRGPGGRKIPGARVEVLTGPSDGRTATNKQGKFRLEGLQAGIYSVSITGKGLSARILEGLMVQGTRATALAVQLSTPDEGAPGVFFGTVKATDGTPIPGAVVEVIDGPTSASTATGLEGRYELGGLAPGTYALRARAEGYLPLTWTGLSLAAGHEVRVDFALRREHGDFGWIFGTVRDAEGHPLHGVLVEVAHGPTIREAKTDELGRYTLHELGPGEYAVTARKSGYQPATREGVVHSGHGTTLDFVLHQEEPTHGRIAGIVRSKSGHALAGAAVEVVAGPTSRSATTGEDGRFTLEELLPGDYRVRASKAGYVSQLAEGRVTAGHTLTMEFSLAREEGGRIFGKVTNHEGHAIAGATVEIVGIETLTTGELGFYESHTLPAGSYTLRVQKTGYRSVIREGVVVTAGQTTRQDFTLEGDESAHGKISGTVKSLSGDAIAEARVEITHGPALKHVFTNAEGRYALEGLPAGTYTLRVSRSGWHTLIEDGIVLETGQHREIHFQLRRVE